MAQTRALGMHEKVWNQRKNIQSHPTEVPVTVPPRIVLAAFLSCTVPCLPLSHIRLLGWTSPACCYPDAAGPDHSSSPDAAYELNPFFPLCVLTPSLFYLPPLHLPFRFCKRHTSNYMLRTKGRTCRSRSPVVRCTWFWAETANTRAKDQKKKKGLYHWFFNFSKLWKSSGLCEANIFNKKSCGDFWCMCQWRAKLQTIS